LNPSVSTTGVPTDVTGRRIQPAVTSGEQATEISRRAASNTGLWLSTDSEAAVGDVLGGEDIVRI
jgi:hypothetical protein